MVVFNKVYKDLHLKQRRVQSYIHVAREDKKINMKKSECVHYIQMCPPATHRCVIKRQGVLVILKYCFYFSIIFPYTFVVERKRKKLSDPMFLFAG